MRVQVIDLVGQPGRSRALSTTVRPVDDELSWGPAEEALAGSIELDLQLEAVGDGIVVRGSVRFPLRVPCARCLEPQHQSRRVEVTELFRDPQRAAHEAELTDDPADDHEAYRISDDRTAIDLTSMLHDVVVMDVPLRVLCREDCRGLCPECGTDRNVEDCGHRPRSRPDPRWAKLRELDLPASRN